MINNLQCTEVFESRKGWVRNISWEYNGTKNYVECSDYTQYSELIKSLVDSQIDKKVPYSKVVYIKGKR